VIRDELQELQKASKTDEQLLQETDDSSNSLPQQARHFLVFIATTWSEKLSQEFLVARYGKKSIESDFLVDAVRSIIVDLGLYGFIVDTITGDGASENRKVFKMLATFSARQVFFELNGERIWPEDYLDGLPLDFKIAFRHPTPSYNNLIFIGGEMPHLAKKFRNNMSNKSRKLVFCGKSVNLQKCYVAWQSVGNCNVASLKQGITLQKWRFTKEHFVLNAYNKMRVYLAVQITSQSMIEMIKEFCQPPNKGVISEYEPMIELLNAMDRLIDIMNGKPFNRGKNLNVWAIDSPNDPLIVELFNILRLIEEWKIKAGGFNENFLSKQTYEDLVWCVFGVAGVAGVNLKNDGTLKMHQGRSGSDCFEHFFSKLRGIHPNANLQQCREGASKLSGNNIRTQAFLKKGGGNVAGSTTTHQELLTPMQKVLKPTKKKD
jgi:hypothetical protein